MLADTPETHTTCCGHAREDTRADVTMMLRGFQL